MILWFLPASLPWWRHTSIWRKSLHWPGLDRPWCFCSFHLCLQPGLQSKAMVFWRWTWHSCQKPCTSPHWGFSWVAFRSAFLPDFLHKAWFCHGHRKGKSPFFQKWIIWFVSILVFILWQCNRACKCCKARVSISNGNNYYRFNWRFVNVTVALSHESWQDGN